MPVVSFTNCALFSVDKYARRNGKTTSTSGPVAEGGRKINIGGSSCHNVSGATTNRGTIATIRKTDICEFCPLCVSTITEAYGKDVCFIWFVSVPSQMSFAY